MHSPQHHSATRTSSRWRRLLADHGDGIVVSLLADAGPVDEDDRNYGRMPRLGVRCIRCMPD